MAGTDTGDPDADYLASLNQELNVEGNYLQSYQDGGGVTGSVDTDDVQTDVTNDGDDEDVEPQRSRQVVGSPAGQPLSDDQVRQLGLPGMGGDENDGALSYAEAHSLGLPEAPVSTAGAVGAHAAASLLPAAASVPAGIAGFGAGATVGAEIGGALGLPAGPVGVGAGLVIGGLLGGGVAWLASKAQDWVADKLGLSQDVNDYLQRSENQKPIASFIGGLLPYAATMRPSMGANIAARAAGGAAGAGLEAGQEAYNEGTLDPTKIALSGAAGALLDKPYPWTQAAGNVASRVGQSLDAVARQRPGRPDIQPDVKTVTDKAEAAQAEPPKVSLGWAAVQPPPPENNVSVGNPQSSPVRSSREYPTEANPYAPNPATSPKPQPGIDRELIPSDQMAALDGANGNTEPPAGATDVSTAQPVGQHGPLPEPTTSPGATAQQAAPQQAQGDYWMQASPGDTFPHPEAPGITIDKTKSIPWVAGTSNDARTVYVSNQVPDLIQVNGKPLNPAYPTAIHELAERSGIAALEQYLQEHPEAGWTRDQIYDFAHEHFGNKAERQWIEGHGYDWDAYQQQMHELAQKTEHQPAGQRVTPDDLFDKIYPPNEAKAIEGEAPAQHTADANTAEPVQPAEAPVQGEVPGSTQATLPPQAEETPVAPAGPRVPRILPDQTQPSLPEPAVRPAAAEREAPAQNVVNTGEGTVKAKSEVSARNKQHVVDAAQNAYDAYPPGENENKGDTVQRAKNAIARATSEALGNPFAYRNKQPTAAQMWLAGAKRVLQGTDKDWKDFQALEAQLRSGGAEEARANKRTEGDVARRQGPSTDVAEAMAATREPTYETNAPITPEEALIRAQEAQPDEDVFEHTAEDAEQYLGEGKPLTPEALQDMAGQRGQAPKEVPAYEQQAQAMREKTARLRAQREAAGNVTPARARPELEQLAGEELKPEKEETPVDALARFFADESGAFNPQALAKSVMGLFKGKQGKQYAQRYISRDAQSDQEEYGRSLGDDFHGLRKAQDQNSIALEQRVNAMPKEAADPRLLGDLYAAREKGFLNGGKWQFGQPGSREMNLYNQFWKPIMDANDNMFKLIKQVAPDLFGPEVENHIYRVPARGTDPGAGGIDPITGRVRTLKPMEDTLRQRQFLVAERTSDGKRVVISPAELGNVDGFVQWDKYKSKTQNSPGFEFKAGEKFSDGKDHWITKEATTNEIEQNANFADGKPAQYVNNLGMSAILANQQLSKVLSHLLMYEKLKTSPEFQKYGTTDEKVATKRGWVPTDLKQFRGWWFDPQVKYALDDFARPGLGSDALDRVNDLSQKLTKLMFLTPVPHVMNVFGHYFVERGWRNVMPQAYATQATSGIHAATSVLNQDGFQKGLRLIARAGTQYDRVISNDLQQRMAQKLQVTMQKDPRFLDSVLNPIKNATGVDPRDAVDWLYANSSKAMWAANDMLHSGLVMERMNEMGHDFSDLHDYNYLLQHKDDLNKAVVAVERGFPNYRLPSTVLNADPSGRVISKFMQSSIPFTFNRYHYGMWNAYANMFKDIVSGKKEATVEGVGKLMALGLLGFAVKPLILDNAAKLITQNPNAQFNPFGPLSVPTHLANAANEGEDPLSAARSTLTESPLTSTAIETLENRDFRGKPIVQPGDVMRAAHGDVRAAGRAVVQEAGHAARGLISPLATVLNASKGRASIPDAMKAIAAQLAGIKNPTEQQVAGKQRYKNQAIKDALQRQRKPYYPEEQLYNSLTNH